MVPRRRWLVVLAAIALMAVGCGAPAASPAVTQTAPLATAALADPTAAPSVVRLAADGQSGAASATPLAPTSLPSPLPTSPAVKPATPAPRAAFAPELAAELQAALDRTVADGFVPGAVLAVHIPGQAPWAGASGFLDRERSQPMDVTTEVRIASISKIFTAVVVLQLVEEGRLQLDTPIAAWYPALVPNAEQVTVRRLLNHTTGLYDYLEDRRFLGRAFQKPDYHWQPEELVAYAAQHPAAFSPGAPGAWDYSSTNYVLLGMVVEQATGNSLAHEMRRRIFEPLELERTYFAPDEPPRGIEARGYRHDHDYTDISLSFAYATANIVSTAGDVQRFGDALFGGQLLRPETLALMQTFEDGKGQYNMPELEYGLGIMRNRLPVGPDARGLARPAVASQVLGHTGGFGGFRSALWHAPETGVTIALGMNQGGTDPNILATQVFDAVLRSQGR